MRKTNLYLMIALVVQAGLSAVTWTTCEPGSGVPDPKKLLQIDVNEVTTLEVTDKPNQEDDTLKKVTLEKKAGKWVVASAADFPADESKVREVLHKLAALKAAEPIATQAANHNALNVGDREYGRKVTVKTASKSESLIIGDGPGQSLHVRFGGKDEVFRSKGLSVWAVKSNLSGYIDTQYVEVDKDKLTTVSVTNDKGSLTFTKQGDKWSLAELPEGSALDESKVNTFMTEVAKLSLNEPVGREVKPEHDLDAGVRVRLDYADDGEPRVLSYTVGSEKDESYYYVKADSSDFVVTVSKWSTDQVREKAAADFVKQD